MTQLSASAMTNLTVGQKAKETTINTNFELSRSTLNVKPEFLGDFDTASEPSTSNIITGSIYYNTDDTEMKYLNASAAWVQVAKHPEFLGSLAATPSATGVTVGSRYYNSSAANFSTLIDASTWTVE